MNELVTIRNDKVVCDSLEVAKMFQKTHNHVLRDIETLLGGVSKIGHTQQMFDKGYRINEQNGQRYPIYYMNRDGFSLLAMGFTGKKALEWKLKYIEAFNKMESVLSEKTTETWVESRKQSMLGRKAETDTIKKFIDYAREQGSKNADKYYVHFTNLANKLVGIEKGGRDMATTFQLNSLTFVESIILRTIESNLVVGTEYHEIFQKCRRAIDDFKDLTAFDNLSQIVQKGEQA